MSERHEYRVDYRAAATRRWRLYPAPFSSKSEALRFGESLLQSGEATAVRIYEEHVTRELWLGSYLATYLERDVRNILQIGNLRDCDRFLRVAAFRAGQLLSYSERARDVGIAPNTARAWLSILETSRQVFLLEPYHTHGAKRIVKTPKLYFTDTGMLLYLLGFAQWDDVTRHAMWGAVWENFVVAEIRKYYLNAGRRPALWFGPAGHTRPDCPLPRPRG